VVIGFLVLAMVLANGLFHRAGAHAIDREVARACYERAGWLAVELSASLKPDGSSTERSKELLYRAARQMDVSLVMFYEADVPVLTAHGPSLSRALKNFEKYPQAGARMDSGATPWVPRFGDHDRRKYPDRGGRPVRVQEQFPYSIETPVGSRMSLRVVPLSIDPVSTRAFTNGLAFVGLMLILASILVVGRVMRPLQQLADGVARLGRGDPSPIRVQGSGEIARVARSMNRMAELTVTSRSEGQRVLSTITLAFSRPVGAAVDSVQAIDLTAVPPSARKGVEALIGNVDDLAEVVDAIGTWADLEAGTVELEREDAELRLLIEVAAAAVDSESVLDFDDDVEEYVETDADAFARVLREVFDNAALYGASPIDVQATRGHTKIELTIRDHGPGIPDVQEMRRVFSAFYRGAGIDTPGLGLGLRIARLMMDALRGGISLKNHPDGGLEVRLWLPAPPIRVTEIDRGLATMGWNESQDVEIVRTDPGRLVPTPPVTDPSKWKPQPPPGGARPAVETVKPAPPAPAPKAEAAAPKSPPKKAPSPKKEAVAAKTAPKKKKAPSPKKEVVAAKTAPKKKKAEPKAASDPPKVESPPTQAALDDDDDFFDPMESEPASSKTIGPVPVAPSTPPPKPPQLEDDPYEPF
jgi:signal transduction histidine kinase